MVKIDESRCMGCGICASICPDGIEVIGGTAKIKNENATCIKEAAASCPRHAIILENTESSQNAPLYNRRSGLGLRMRGRRHRRGRR